MLKCENQSIEMNHMQVLYTEIWLSHCFEILENQSIKILATVNAQWCVSKVLTPIEGFSFCFCTFISVHQFFSVFHLPIVGYKIRIYKEWQVDRFVTSVSHVYLCSQGIIQKRSILTKTNSHVMQWWTKARDESNVG